MNVIVYGATTNSFWIRYPSGAEELFIFDGKDWDFLLTSTVDMTDPTEEEIDERENLSKEDISNMHQVIITLNRCGQKEAQISLKPLKVTTS